MATQTYTDGVTLTAAAEFNRFDTVSYAVLTGVAGTNTITATGPANYTYAATTPPVWFIPAVTNTGATTLNVTPSGASALGAKNIFAGGLALVGGELVSGVPACAIYDGTRFQLLGVFQASAAWTPVLTFETAGNLAVTYSTQSGTYVRVGRLVTVTFAIITSAFTHTTASGSCEITGLPYTVLSGLDHIGGLGWNGITKANYTNVCVQAMNNTTKLRLIASGSGQSAANIATGDMPTGGSVFLKGTAAYMV